MLLQILAQRSQIIFSHFRYKQQNELVIPWDQKLLGLRML